MHSATGSPGTGMGNGWVAVTEALGTPSTSSLPGLCPRTCVLGGGWDLGVISETPYYPKLQTRICSPVMSTGVQHATF